MKVTKEETADKDGDCIMKLATVEECEESRPGASPEDANIEKSIAKEELLRFQGRAFVVAMVPPKRNPYFLTPDSFDFDSKYMIPKGQGAVTIDGKLIDINGEYIKAEMFDLAVQTQLEKARINWEIAQLEWGESKEDAYDRLIAQQMRAPRD